MIVAGGSYLEICMRPDWRRLFGSGLRAACAIGPLSPNTILHTYGFKDWAADIVHSAAAFRCRALIRPIDDAISFSYEHPLSIPGLHPSAPIRLPPLDVEGEVVLRFGFVEGDAVVSSKRAVYDPQSASGGPPFGANGSKADHIAVVLNEDEAAASGFDGQCGYGDLLDVHGAEVAVIKRGPRGASVHARDGSVSHISAYRSDNIFKIGSGDVFSAAFALYWGERGIDAAAAADMASRSVARFVDGHTLPLEEVGTESVGRPANFNGSGPVYLAGPFFDLGQQWLIEEARRTIKRFGIDVFSPLHDVGTGLSSAEIANADLKGLRSCTKVFAIMNGMDPGTVFEVGYAAALGIPVVALIERSEQEHLTMIEGSGCEVASDFTSAIYRLFWRPSR